MRKKKISKCIHFWIVSKVHACAHVWIPLISPFITILCDLDFSNIKIYTIVCSENFSEMPSRRKILFTKDQLLA